MVAWPTSKRAFLREQFWTDSANEVVAVPLRREREDFEWGSVHDPLILAKVAVVSHLVETGKVMVSPYTAIRRL